MKFTAKRWQQITPDFGQGDWGQVNEKVDENRRCLHKSCPDCHGKGRKSDGQLCIHYISCFCPKCRPTYVNIPKFIK